MSAGDGVDIHAPVATAPDVKSAPESGVGEGARGMPYDPTGATDPGALLTRSQPIVLSASRPNPRISTETGPARTAEETKPVVVPPSPLPEPKSVAIGDDLTIVAKADKEGRIRLTSRSIEGYAAVLPGQVLELRWDAGRVRATVRTVEGGR